MVIQFFSDPVRVFSMRCNPIQVLLIQSDPVLVLKTPSKIVKSRQKYSNGQVPYHCSMHEVVCEFELEKILIIE